MAQYGRLLFDVDPRKEELYKHFDEYFAHPILTKIKDVQNNSIYMVKTTCLLSNFCRYIVAIVEKDLHEINQRIPLSELSWISLQTRTLEDQHQINSHYYQPELKGPLTCSIKREKIENNSSIYSCNDFPLEIVLLHKKKDIESEYQPTGKLISALETFQTIITFKK
jgi:hypothetical protein